ncbi:MAG: abortive phage resistance protein [Betaproteobacteria bacterium HGW-Betaproteobacteria-9]|jgi:abortive infection bacteriophage resistance protein|nr:MAG: abortive phage resistance protein [Betaproteobacteria bacterium HGW-Betaproteobacteria-9]
MNATRHTPAFKPLKPWISFADQLAQLEQRGMEVENKVAALDYLERIGYYRLSGYWYPMRAIDIAASLAQGQAVRSNAFVGGTRFEDVVHLYVFDKKLRLLALDALERIELAVRVDVAHLLGQRDPKAHENPACLHGNFAKKVITKGPDTGKTEHQVWLSKFQALLQRARKEPFVQHHKQQYGALPIWAAIEVWDFGLLSKLFAGMKHADQQAVAAIYGAPDGQTFAQWLRSLNFIRNVSAHHSRLWNLNVVERASLPADWPAALDNSRPFFYFCLMQQLLNVICPNSAWGQRVTELLEGGFPNTQNGVLSLDDLGAVVGWAETMPWKKQAPK